MYATLDDAKAEIKTQNALTAADSQWLQRQLRYVSGRIGRLAQGAGYEFEPRYATERFTARSTNVNSNERIFYPGKDLLELDSITKDGTALVLNTTVYLEPLGVSPIKAFRLAPNCGLSWWSTQSDPYNQIVIAGWWGWRRYYDTEGFLEVDSVQDVGGINAAATTVTCSDVDGVDYYGIPPRISAGNLLRLEDELVEVTATNTTLQTATIKRAQRGTTAAAHGQTTPIRVWYVEPEIRRACARQTAYLYARKGAFQSADYSELGIVQYPPDLVMEIRGILQEMQYA